MAGYADFNTDPYSGVKRRVVQSLDPNAAAAPEPTSSLVGTGKDTAGFVGAAPFREPMGGSGDGPVPTGPGIPVPTQPGPVPTGPGLPLGGQPGMPTEPPSMPPLDPTRVALGNQPGMPTEPGFPPPLNYSQAAAPDVPGADNPPPYVTQPIAPPPVTTPAPTSTAPTVARTTLDPAQQSNAAGGTPNYDSINALYQKYLGRPASQDEAANWANGTYGASDLPGIEKQISESGEASDYRKNNGGGATAGTDDRSRVDALLAKYQSTDDPNYWYNLVQQHGGFDATGAAWLEDRIMRGDGAIGVRNGTVQKFQDKGGSGGGTQPPSTYTPPTGPTAPTSTTQFQDAIRQQIMDRLKSAGMPVDQNAAGITDAVSAARDDTTRAGEQERTALAERLYAQGGGGLNSGALTQQIQQSGEKVAQTTSGLRANLIMQEYGRKQQELDQLLSMATASGDAESARNIQIYMAQLQAELQREGISADLAKYAAYLNNQTALAGLGQ